MKQKVIMLTILLFVGILIAAGVTYGIPAYQEYKIQKAEEERRSQSEYYTEFHLSWGQLYDLKSCFGIKSSEPLGIKTPDDEDWPDYSYYTMEPTEYTEKMVVVLTYNLFVNPQTKGDLAAAELAAEYGFSAENPITVDWVLEHPAEAVEIHKETRSLDYYFVGGNDVEDAYNEIMGIKDTEETGTPEDEAAD